MATVREIIRDAYRETNLIPIGTPPTTEMFSEGLTRLQVLVGGVFGNEAGEKLQPLPLGQQDIKSPQGYPIYGNVIPGDLFIPSNVRVMCNLTAASYVYLDPLPSDGARFGVVDVGMNFGTFPFTIFGNGRSIEMDNDLILNTSGTTREWFYREDLGNWMRVTGLRLDDPMPFPLEFDDMFVVMLAMRINPRYGQALTAESQGALQRARSQFRARYRQTTEVPVEDGLLRLAGGTKDRAWLGGRIRGNSSSYFSSGYPF